MSKHEKNILIELTEQQRLDIEKISIRCEREVVDKLWENQPFNEVESASKYFIEALKSELSTLIFNHAKELADKDDVIARLLKQVK